MINGKYEKREFTGIKDVWDVIDILVKDTLGFNQKMGKDFDIALAVSAQLPLFSCPNVVFDKWSNTQINRYQYCKEFGIKPFNGDYSEQPAKWIEVYKVIKNATIVAERKAIKDAS